MFNGFVVAWVVSEFWIRLSRPAHTGTARTTTNLTSRAVIILGVGGGIFGAFNVDRSHTGPLIADRSWVVFGAGIVLVACGVALRLWAVRTLGRFFQLDLVVQERHALVSSGPYRLIRHPSYAGILLTCAGIGLALGRWASLALVVTLPSAALVHRIVVEERMLVAGVGDDYARYRRQTWRLVPRIW